MFPGRSITTRLILPIFAAALLIISIGLFVDYQLSRARILAALEQQATAAVESAEQGIKELIIGIEGSIRFTTDLSDGLIDLASNSPRIELDGPAKRDPRQLLESVFASNPHISAAMLIDSVNGRAESAGVYLARIRQDGKQRLVDVAAGFDARSWLELAKQSAAPFWSGPYTALSSGPDVLRFTGALESIDTASRYIAVDVPISVLTEYLEPLSLAETGWGFLLSPEGLLIGAPLDRSLAEPIDLVLTSTETGSISNWTATNQNDQSITVNCPDDRPLCKLRTLAFDQSAWSMGVVYSPQDVLAPLRDYQLKIALVGLFMLLPLALLISLITHKVTQPLLGLVAASKSIAQGELDVPLPSTTPSDEVGTLVNAFDSMRQDLKRYIDRVKNDTAARSRMEGELSAAREIQMEMLPGNGEATLPHKRVEAWARIRPARAVGGDLYSFEQRGDYIYFAIGDVSDKGIPAALFMARAMSLISQWEVQAAPTPPEFALKQLNNALCRDNENCMFLTLSLGVIHTESLSLRFAVAGQTAPMLLRDGVAASIEQERGPALGLQSELDFAANVIQLKPDDRLFFFTDGFDEAQNEKDALLGEDRMQTLLTEADSLPLAEAGDALFKAVDVFAGTRAQADDMTLLILEAKGQRRAPLQAEYASISIDDTIVSASQGWLKRQWQSLGLWDEGLQTMLLVVEEIVANIRNHSNTEADGHEAVIAIGLERFDDRVELECVDPGVPFNPLEDALRAPLGAPIEDATVGGLGVHIITEFTDAQFYHYEHGRNILRVRLVMPPTASNSVFATRE